VGRGLGLRTQKMQSLEKETLREGPDLDGNGKKTKRTKTGKKDLP